MPQSTSAIAYFRPQNISNIALNKSTGIVFYFSPRDLTGLYAQSGITAAANVQNLRSWLPRPQVPLGYVYIDGQRYPVQIEEQTWYKFLYTVAEIRLGGITGAVLPDIVRAITNSQKQSSTVSQNVTALANQTTANAASLLATVQVSQQASLAGAVSIPAPVTYVPFKDATLT